MNNFKKRLKDQRGLTLVELLAVIVILGIIAAIAVPSIGGIIQKSKEDAVKADAIQVLNAAKLHVASTGLPDAATPLSKTVLAPYLEGEKLKEFSVTVTPPTGDEDTNYTITGVGQAGKKWVHFIGATLKNINDNDTQVVVSSSETTPTPPTGD